ncbi:MAG TPA: hypothetical protein P5032_17140 [Candidatus Competibacter sp.]|nr:hypothetical protein [Candidatus Competibacter sp.]
MTSDRIRQWHRLFGITLTDVFRATPWRVELEKELALQSQLLDVVIIEQATGEPALSPPGWELPEGLEGLRAHNLLTYKSQHEALDAWALDELIGHYVNYRKLLSRGAPLPPEADFQLYAVATRFPQGLAAQVPLIPTAWPGVFDVLWGTHPVRLIVLSAIDRHPRNAAWELFSVQQDRIRHGAQHYPWRHTGARELLQQLYLVYVLEEPSMAYTMDEFIREAHQDLLQRLTPEERQAFLNRLDPDERLRGLGPEERLRGLRPEEILQHFSPEERLRGLGPDELQQLKDYLKRLN